MVIIPDAAEGIEVLDPLDFKRFALRLAPGQALEDSQAVVFAPGEAAAWISEAALRAWPGGRGLPGWEEGLTTMVDYARTHGWFDAKTARIRAHVERG